LFFCACVCRLILLYWLLNSSLLALLLLSLAANGAFCSICRRKRKFHTYLTGHAVVLHRAALHIHICIACFACAVGCSFVCAEWLFLVGCELLVGAESGSQLFCGCSVYVHTTPLQHMHTHNCSLRCASDVAGWCIKAGSASVSVHA
jgi:hypothetical protein